MAVSSSSQKEGFLAGSLDGKKWKPTMGWGCASFCLKGKTDTASLFPPEPACTLWKQTFWQNSLWPRSSGLSTPRILDSVGSFLTGKYKCCWFGDMVTERERELVSFKGMPAWNNTAHKQHLILSISCDFCDGDRRMGREGLFLLVEEAYNKNFCWLKTYSKASCIKLSHFTLP